MSNRNCWHACLKTCVVGSYMMTIVTCDSVDVVNFVIYLCGLLRPDGCGT